jgi:hypothetical protein
MTAGGPKVGLPMIGARAQLRRRVDRFPHFAIEAGATGTITDVTDELVAMRIDSYVPGAEDWGNELCWTPEEGEALTGSTASSAEQTAAAFHADAETLQPLSFLDHHRQRYAENVPIAEAGEFLIGDYRDDGSVGEAGEFKITLIELPTTARRRSLHPHLEAFGDGIGSLRQAIEAGLLDRLDPVFSREEFARRLIAIGMVDRSDWPLPKTDGRRGRG